jgi:hypothetical protein
MKKIYVVWEGDDDESMYPSCFFTKREYAVKYLKIEKDFYIEKGREWNSDLHKISVRKISK